MVFLEDFLNIIVIMCYSKIFFTSTPKMLLIKIILGATNEFDRSVLKELVEIRNSTLRSQVVSIAFVGDN